MNWWTCSIYCLDLLQIVAALSTVQSSTCTSSTSKYAQQKKIKSTVHGLFTAFTASPTVFWQFSLCVNHSELIVVAGWPWSPQWVISCQRSFDFLAVRRAQTGSDLSYSFCLCIQELMPFFWITFFRSILKRSRMLGLSTWPRCFWVHSNWRMGAAGGIETWL